MRIDSFEYELPEELIAQEPAERRDHSRLLHADRGADILAEHRFDHLPNLLRVGDLVVVNDAMVDTSRLHARRATGGMIEILLVRELGDGAWEAMVRGGRKLRAGETLTCVAPDADEEPGAASAAAGVPAEAVVDRREIRLTVGEALADGRRVIRVPEASTAEEITARFGEMPLPPYIRRRPGDPRAPLDHDRYQTVYARAHGAVAAPTAGLHFTRELFGRLEEGGIEVATLTLQVGPGTFQPVRSEDVTEHRMEPEPYTLPDAAVAAIVATKERGGRVVGVGTTVVRTLEFAARNAGSIEAAAGAGKADIFIYPGFEFRVIDAMLTNFHLPRSTPILMASAFAGRERLLRAYRFAVQERFRFYSYGDAMLIT